jgi:hypothetical protein
MYVKFCHINLKVSHKHHICKFSHIQMFHIKYVGSEGWLVFGRCLVWLSARTMTTLTRAFMVFLSPSREMLGRYIKLGYNCILAHPSQFTIIQTFHIYCHVSLWLKMGFRLVIEFSNNLQAVTTNNYYTITDFHTFQSSVAHALGFSVSSSCLLAIDLNTEISTSNHYEVFLLFHL